MDSVKKCPSRDTVPLIVCTSAAHRLQPLATTTEVQDHVFLLQSELIHLTLIAIMSPFLSYFSVLKLEVFPIISSRIGANTSSSKIGVFLLLSLLFPVISQLFCCQSIKSRPFTEFICLMEELPILTKGSDCWIWRKYPVLYGPFVKPICRKDLLYKNWPSEN